MALNSTTWFSRAGHRLGTFGDPGENVGFTVAPNLSKRMGAIRTNSQPHGWSMPRQTSAQSSCRTSTTTGRGKQEPVWSPAGDRVFATFRALPQLLRG